MEPDERLDDDTATPVEGQATEPGASETAPLEADGASPDDEVVLPVDEPTVARRGALPKVLVGLGGILLIAILAMQAYIVVSANNTADQVESLETAMSDLSDDVARVEGSVDEVGTQVAEIEAAASNSSPAAGSAAGGNPAPAAVPAGSLPRFESGQQDTGLGLPLGNVAGEEYYTQTALDVDPADGTARMWIIWAHWCPYCQEELPAVSEWWAESGDTFENVEVVSVTTSIDPSRGNELEPYLNDLQLPFPTLVDEDLAMATQLGVSAFPFWVITDGDGTVLYRSAGLMGMEQIESIAGQLEELAA